MNNRDISRSKYIRPTNESLAANGVQVFFSFPVLWLIISIFSGYFTNKYQSHALAILLVTTLLSIIRKWQCKRIAIDPPIIWRKWFSVLTLLNAAWWSSLGLFVISVENSSATSYAWLIGIAGIVAVGVAYLAILPWLTIAFQGILIIPICAWLALQYDSVINVISIFGIAYWLQMIVITTQRAKQHKESLSDKFQLQEVAKKLKFASEMDTLTNIANRGRFETLFTREWETAYRQEQPIAFLIFDLDDFKSINDTYGHQVGDVVLQEFSATLKAKVTRAVDIVARYGGEEFVALLPNTKLDGAIEVAERIRLAVEENTIEINQRKVKVTVSIGIDVVEPRKTAITPAAFIKRADDALYRAKQSGKNKVVCAKN